MTSQRARPRGNHKSTSPIAEFVDRVSGKESVLETEFNKVGIRFGEDQVLGLTGGVSLKLLFLR